MVVGSYFFGRYRFLCSPRTLKPILQFLFKEMSTKVKQAKDEPIAYSEAALRKNMVFVEYCRTSMSALSGSTAGILGLTGLYGFAFYVFSVVVLWMMFMIKAGPHWKKYYVSRQSLLTNGFFGALFTYILFWTFIYGMVHVY